MNCIPMVLTAVKITRNNWNNSKSPKFKQRSEEVKPWELQKQAKTDEVGEFLDEMISGLRRIAHWLTPFMPDTAERLAGMFRADVPIERSDPLFPRLD